jgi:pilus assembly protein CpaE
MSSIILASDSAELEGQVREASGNRSLTVLRGSLPASPAELFDRLDDTTMPDVVVLDAGAGDPQLVLNLAARFDQQCPAISVVLVSDAVASIGLTAMRAGVRDVVHPQADPADLAKALSYAAEVA